MEGTRDNGDILQKLKKSIRTLQDEIKNAETMDELVLLQSVSHSLQTQLKEAVLAYAKKQTALWTPITTDSQTQKPPPLATRLLQTKAASLGGGVGGN